ncbi:phage replication protein [Chitinimonas prasina]|uniref:Phage replication protein n=1 Tax=Chitinimonas prasina TaxID=1434937 RepID=A0ABQ5YD43_9NEIS|nr:replication initiation factor domain-containing protein [Chitinimonas prasina]GLR12890.1 phage replication protein [Chitinimonas prasina]
MARQSKPHAAYNRAEAAERARIKRESATALSVHQVAAQLGARKAVIALAAERARLVDSQREAVTAAGGASATTAQAKPAPASPTSNTGGKGQQGGKALNVQLVTDGRKTKVVSVRDNSASGQCAMIDTLSVVFHIDTLRRMAPLNRAVEGGTDEDTDDLIISFHQTFQAIFGVAITRRNASGRNYYRNSYEIGEGLGHVGIGGNQDTVQIHLDGKGCLLADEGWEQRLHDWLTKTAVSPRITRIDLAHDDFQGDITVDHMFVAYQQGMFTNGGRPPKGELRGDWIEPDGSGRTLYVGSRENGLLYRGYEKGREQGDRESPWVRHELQLGNKCRVIPLNALVFPGQYFAGAYAALHQFADVQVRIETERKSAEASLAHVTSTAKNQVGRAINLLLDIYRDPAKVVAELIREGYPKAFKHHQGDHWTPMTTDAVPSEIIAYEKAFNDQWPSVQTATGWHSIPTHALSNEENFNHIYIDRLKPT